MQTEVTQHTAWQAEATTVLTALMAKQRQNESVLDRLGRVGAELVHLQERLEMSYITSHFVSFFEYGTF
jgi:hypothetical protein